METMMNEKIKTQILKVRDTGLTNMFDTNVVPKIAFEMELYELVNFLEDNKKAYVHFILTGEG